ncbi:uncharacterized protein LOC134458919 [Engraulis encrasicolus]|uniref:uncharacterized protein LOC134458919 n=1 Tax=Engraulis encrasicolus TaxID=184585 RepID=UPI002FD793A5
MRGICESLLEATDSLTISSVRAVVSSTSCRGAPVMTVTPVQIRLIGVGLVLVVCNVLYINWVLLSKPHPDSPPQESKKAHLSLRASKDSSYTSELGAVRWERDAVVGVGMRLEAGVGMRLEAGGTQIVADVAGLYVVFVQAVFYLNKTAVELSQRDDNGDASGVIRLRLQLNTNESESWSESELVAAWEELTVKDLRDEQIARLSFMTQVELRRHQYVLVKAKHLDKLNYDEPVSTTLSIYWIDQVDTADRGGRRTRRAVGERGGRHARPPVATAGRTRR